MQLEIYKNYGCLAAEKRAIYTFGCPEGTATCWDKMKVQTPKSWEESKNELGRPFFRPQGQKYWWEVNEVLSGNKKPMFIYYGEENGVQKIFQAELEEINEK